MDKIHLIEPQGLDGYILTLHIDGHTHAIDLAAASKKLAKATDTQLKNFIITPSGYGIHWPQLDEDLAIDPLIGIQHETPVWKVAEAKPRYITKEEK